LSWARQLILTLMAFHRIVRCDVPGAAISLEPGIPRDGNIAVGSRNRIRTSHPVERRSPRPTWITAYTRERILACSAYIRWPRKVFPACRRRSKREAGGRARMRKSRGRVPAVGSPRSSVPKLGGMLRNGSTDYEKRSGIAGVSLISNFDEHLKSLLLQSSVRRLESRRTIAAGAEMRRAGREGERSGAVRRL
jgi:hypothetical protein